MDLLSGLGYALDTPGALTRGLLTGRPGERASGEDLLRALGIEDAGWLANTATELVADPMNLIGGLGVAKKLLAPMKARAANVSALKMGGEANILADRTRRTMADALGAANEIQRGNEMRQAGAANAAIAKTALDKKVADIVSATPGATPEVIQKMLTAPVDDAAQLIGSLLGGKNVEPMPPMFQRSGLRWYDFSPPEGLHGAVHSARPEVQMIRRGLAPKRGASTGVHEAVHYAQHELPQVANTLDVATKVHGLDAVEQVAGRDFAESLLMKHLGQGLGGAQQFNLASEGAPYTMTHLLNQQPKIGEVLGQWNAGLATEAEAKTAIREGVIKAFPRHNRQLEEMQAAARSGKSMRRYLGQEVGSGIPAMTEKDANEIVNSLVAILSGEGRNANALVPVGVAEDIMRSRAVPRVPIAPQNPAPYMEPILHRIPSRREANPLIAALLGYNVANQSLPQ